MIIQERIDAFRAIDIRDYQERISKEYAAIGDHVLYGGKYAGSDAERAGSEYIAAELEKLGIDTIEKVEFETIRFQCNDITLTVADGGGETITYKPGPYVSPATDADGITAELLDMGEYSLAWLEENDVRGKIVLMNSRIGLAGVAHGYQCMELETHGAAAVIIYQADNNIDDTTLRSGTFVKKLGIPVVGVNTIDAGRLRDQLAKGEATATLVVDGEYKDKALSQEIVAEIKGKTDERIIFSGHLDHYFTCMQDNIASVVGMLGIAKSMIDAGIKPNRTITFIFSSSHELSAKESLNPYIYGSYYVLCEKHPEWIKKTMYDINFEYMALEEKALRSYGSPEVEASYNRFIDYMPQEQPGFGEIAEGFDPASYMLMAWEDSVSFTASGITCIANDPITEQMAGDSPYVGRDHSTSDNWDAFSLDAIGSTTKWYGALGLYLDATPIPELDFRGRTQNLRFTEQEQPVLDAMGYDTSAYNAVLDSIDAKAAKVVEAIQIRNGNRTELAEADENVIADLIEIRQNYSALTDTFNAQGFFSPLHKKYIMSVALLSGGIEMLKAGELEGAMTNCLGFEDYLGVVYQYGPNVGKLLAEIAADETALTWNRGKRSTVVILPETMESLRVKGLAGNTDFAEEVKVLEGALNEESALMMQTLQAAVEALQKIDAQMAAFLQKLA